MCAIISGTYAEWKKKMRNSVNPVFTTLSEINVLQARKIAPTCNATILLYSNNTLVNVLVKFFKKMHF